MNYYDINGDVISIGRFQEMYADREYRRIASSQVGESLVSTVWLGIDHSWGTGAPLIFETMVFNNGGTTSKQQCWRYPTLEQASAGHQEQVTILELEANYAQVR